MNLQVLPGRVAVLLPTAPESIVQVPDWLRRKEEAIRGSPREGRRGTVLASGVRGLNPGDEVAVRMDAACLAINSQDYDFVPPNHEVRIFGVFAPGTDAVLWRVTHD